MKIFVIGGASFIGSHLIRKLLAKRHSVAALDMHPSIAKKILPREVTVYSGDGCHAEEMRDIIQKERPDVVIQADKQNDMSLAVSMPFSCYLSESVRNVFLLHNLVKNGVKRVIYLSSAAVYGNVDSLPILLHSPKNPISPIGVSENFVEQMLKSFQLSDHLSFSIVRLANVIGLSENENEYWVQKRCEGLIHSILDYFLGDRPHVEIYGTSYATVDGTPERDYIHVDDACDACIGALDALWGYEDHLEFNIGMGRKYSVKDVIQAMEKLFGKKIETVAQYQREGDVGRYYFDHSFACNQLGWNPKYDTLEAILKTLVPYYRPHMK